MNSILGLLFLGGAIAVIVIGTRISLYFYLQDVVGVQPFSPRHMRAFSTEQTTLERSGTLYKAEYVNASSRYAWGALALIASIMIVSILVVVSFLLSVVH